MSSTSAVARGVRRSFCPAVSVGATRSRQPKPSRQPTPSRQLSPPSFVLLSLTLLLGAALSSAAPATSAAADSPQADAGYEHERTISRGRVMGPTSSYLQGSRSDSFSEIERATTNEGRNLSCVVEGDIRICDAGEQRAQERKGGAVARRKRQTVNSKYYDLWSANAVKYVIDRSTYQSPGAVASSIRAAMDAWESKTCLRFVEIDMPSDPNDDSVNYMRIYSGTGCWSYVGRLGGRQDVSLAEVGCIFKGVIMHEFGHALGLVHQQSRPDRESYISVLTNNIRRGYALNFFKSPCPTVKPSVRFDIESVMQYGLSDFAAKLATIRPKSNEYASLAGNRASATHYDYMAVSGLYQCQAGCANTCENDGYPLRDARGACTCVCPYGLGGPTCASYDSTKFTCGGVIQLNATDSPYNLIASSTAAAGKCAWLFKVPKGNIVKMSFQQFSVATSAGQCAHYVEIRKNLIGQSGPLLYCGNGNPNDVYSRNDYESNAALVIFDYTAPASIASSFTARVSAYSDGCLGDPCRGAPCQPLPGGAYRCQLSLANVSCAFERLSSTGCTAIRMNGWGPNGGIDCNAQQRTWEVIDAASTTVQAREGAYFISSDAREDEGTTARGSFRILPQGFRQGVPRCLRFAYYMESSAAGTLNIYRSVNGNNGRPLLSFNAAASPAASGSWLNASVSVASPNPSSVPQELVEIIFEAVHSGGGAEGSLIAIDNIRYSIGACPTGPCANDPCGDSNGVCVELAPTASRPTPAFTCVSPGYPDGDSKCSFEDWEDCSPLLNLNTTAGPGNQPASVAGDSTSWVTYKWAGPGRKWPYTTGAAGPATGLTYLYAKLYDKKPKDRARFLLNAFSGPRCLTFKFVLNGVNCGALRVYRAVNGDYNRPTLLWAAQGNQSPMWLQAVVNVSVADLPSNARVEVIVEAERGSWPNTVPGYYATDVALDDIRYTSGTCDRNPIGPNPSPLIIPTTTTTTVKPRCSWVWKNSWVWVCS